MIEYYFRHSTAPNNPNLRSSDHQADDEDYDDNRDKAIEFWKDVDVLLQLLW